jgi:hypothetical protein
MDEIKEIPSDFHIPIGGHSGYGAGKVIFDKIPNAKRVWVVTPFIDKQAGKLLAEVKEKGTDVKIITAWHEENIPALKHFLRKVSLKTSRRAVPRLVLKSIGLLLIFASIYGFFFIEEILITGIIFGIGIGLAPGNSDRDIYEFDFEAIRLYQLTDDINIKYVLIDNVLYTGNNKLAHEFIDRRFDNIQATINRNEIANFEMNFTNNFRNLYDFSKRLPVIETLLTS